MVYVNAKLVFILILWVQQYVLLVQVNYQTVQFVKNQLLEHSNVWLVIQPQCGQALLAYYAQFQTVKRLHILQVNAFVLYVT